MGLHAPVIRLEPRHHLEPVVVALDPAALVVDELDTPERRAGPRQRPVILPLEGLAPHTLPHLSPRDLTDSLAVAAHREHPGVALNGPVEELRLLGRKHVLDEDPLPVAVVVDVPVANRASTPHVRGDDVAVPDGSKGHGRTPVPP